MTKKAQAPATPDPEDEDTSSAGSGGVSGQGTPINAARANDCPTCHYYEFSHLNSGDASLQYGFCRRYAPRPNAYAGQTAALEYWWPRVHSGDWCGEYVQADDD